MGTVGSRGWRREGRTAVDARRGVNTGPAAPRHRGRTRRRPAGPGERKEQPPRFVGGCRETVTVLFTQLPAVGWTEEPTNEKVLLALDPRVVMAAMHTTTIRASITAYSTAVGPSSAFRNETRL